MTECEEQRPEVEEAGKVSEVNEAIESQSDECDNHADHPVKLNHPKRNSGVRNRVEIREVRAVKLDSNPRKYPLDYTLFDLLLFLFDSCLPVTLRL